MEKFQCNYKRHAQYSYKHLLWEHQYMMNHWSPPKCFIWRNNTLVHPSREQSVVRATSWLVAQEFLACCRRILAILLIYSQCFSYVAIATIRGYYYPIHTVVTCRLLTLVYVNLAASFGNSHTTEQPPKQCTRNFAFPRTALSRSFLSRPTLRCAQNRVIPHLSLSRCQSSEYISRIRAIRKEMSTLVCLPEPEHLTAIPTSSKFPFFYIVSILVFICVSKQFRSEFLKSPILFENRSLELFPYSRSSSTLTSNFHIRYLFALCPPCHFYT